MRLYNLIVPNYPSIYPSIHLLIQSLTVFSSIGHAVVAHQKQNSIIWQGLNHFHHSPIHSLGDDGNGNKDNDNEHANGKNYNMVYDDNDGLR